MAKLAKLLQKDFGVGLAGAVIISPALINTQLRRNVGLKTDRDYELISMKVNTAW